MELKTRRQLALVAFTWICLYILAIVTSMVALEAKHELLASGIIHCVSSVFVLFEVWQFVGTRDIPFGDGGWGSFIGISLSINMVAGLLAIAQIDNRGFTNSILDVELIVSIAGLAVLALILVVVTLIRLGMLIALFTTYIVTVFNKIWTDPEEPGSVI